MTFHPAINFQLAPSPILKETALEKSCQTTAVINLAKEQIQARGAKISLLPFDRIENIKAFRCQSDFLTSFGKGFTAEQATASAIMEHYERLVWQTYPFKEQYDYCVTSFAKMFVAHQSIVPASYFLQNLLDPEKWVSYLREIGQAQLHWLPIWSFIDKDSGYYPVNWHNICYTSNGLAAGGTLSEALLQGLCEVVERENLWRWLAERQDAPMVDNDSIDDPECQEIFRQAAEIGIKVIIRDTSLTANLPCYSVYGQYNTAEGAKIHFSAAGHGCHPTPLTALKRALSEYFASQEINSSCGSDGLWKKDLPDYYPLMKLDFNRDLLDIPDSSIPFVNSSPFMAPDLTESFEMICAALGQLGYQVGARILNPGEPLPVVRVIVPNMRALFATETDDLRPIIAQILHEGANDPRAMEIFLEMARDPNSSMVKLAGDNLLIITLMPLVIQQLGLKFFLGSDYQETMKKFKNSELNFDSVKQMVSSFQK